jgi:hypothetical protein
MTYAFSFIPEEKPGPDGKAVKVDKSDPNKFLLPNDDARRVIRAATRSAYAEACELPELAKANYQTLIKSEEARKVWSEQQLLMVYALHMFSASYFAGGVKISEAPEGAPADGTTTISKGDASEGADQGAEMVGPKRPQCPPEQKQKVMNSINAYVQAAPAPPPPGSPPPP